MGKFATSKYLALASWELLKKDKEMLYFPLLSMLSSILFVAIILFLFYALVLGLDTTSWGSAPNVDSLKFFAFVFSFILYLGIYFIAIFFQSCIVKIAHGRIEGNDLTFRDGINATFNHIGAIFVWSVISATVGFILQIIAERSKLIGKIIVWLLGSAWGILTYFMVPILIIDNASIKNSLKSSAVTIKKTWGETAILHVGVGMVFGLLAVAGFIVMFISIFASSVYVIAPIMILGFLYILALSLIASTLNTILRVVLYIYAKTGKTADGFDVTILESAFQPK